MKSKEDIKVAIADGSVIMRSGLASVLKHFSEFNFRINEITNQEALTIFLRLHTPDLLIINPLLQLAWIWQQSGKHIHHWKLRHWRHHLSTTSLLSDYDTTISINDDIETICSKIKEVVNEPDEESSEQDALSAREKEIIGCVVKGMTNKAIADTLSISIYTVITHRRNISRKLQIHSCRSGNLCNCK